jgi:hypothetical protein
MEQEDVMEDQKWIGVDFDGTIARYDGWKGPTHLGEPLMGMINKVKQWLAEGKTVKIFTARVATDDDMPIPEKVKLIQDWCEQHIGQRLDVTAVKDPGCEAIYDDKAYHVPMNSLARLLGLQ